MSKTTKIDPEDGKLKKKTPSEVLEGTKIGETASKAKDEVKEGLLKKLKPKKERKTGWWDDGS